MAPTASNVLTSSRSCPGERVTVRRVERGAPLSSYVGEVDFGAHLPLLDFGAHPFTLGHLVDYTRAASDLGFAALSANDHMVFAVPWLDGPTALAAVASHAGTMTLATTVALPVVRGPVPLAKTLAALDRLVDGRLLVGVGPGSSGHDYAAVGIDFAQRWERLDEAVETLRRLWHPTETPFTGRFYSTAGIDLRPAPSRPEGPPIWIGSWGSNTGLRRVARLADGWLASAYNITPDDFAAARDRLSTYLIAAGRAAASFPNALATMWCYVTDSRSEAESVLRERVAPVVHRPEEVLRERLPIGSATAFAEKLVAFRDAGVQRVFIWPVTDERRQLELFVDKVVPLLDA
jgi:alkanesulfonate monooxygenase SsuD/methylene tetrahydromethanopterin reductase-like flavin-dependent oxidoreductase (luciferase family)